jgi:hypothetical protein
MPVQGPAVRKLGELAVDTRVTLSGKGVYRSFQRQISLRHACVLPGLTEPLWAKVKLGLYIAIDEHEINLESHMGIRDE